MISAGGETQIVYSINKNGTIRSAHSGNKCASGTGEFFLQQIRRMGLTIEEAVKIARDGTPHKIAGRCSVFCKSDCTHALNKGEPRENIVAGLCLMMADKVCDLVKDMQCEKAVLIGGGSLNDTMVAILRGRFTEMDVPAHAAVFEALGAAIWASTHQCIPLARDVDTILMEPPDTFGRHQPLHDALPLVNFKSGVRGTVAEHDTCILGLDVGSTTTKAVLMRQSDSLIIASVYLRTNGDPLSAARECYRGLKEELRGTPVKIIALGVTGSGRQIATLMP